jgi:hypothetical protein
MGSLEPIYAKSKGVNQILKERGPRGGETEKLLKAGETKAFANKKTSAEANETTGTATKSEP